MRKYLSIAGILLYLVIVFKPSFPALSFLFNQDFFAKERCINKARPELKCNGHCQMKRMAEENAAHEEEQSGNSVSMESAPVSIVPEQIAFGDCAVHSPETNAIVNNLYQFDFLNSCWHPPSFAIKT